MWKIPINNSILPSCISPVRNKKIGISHIKKVFYEGIVVKMTILKVDGHRLVRNIPDLKTVAKQQTPYFLNFNSAISFLIK